MSDELEVTLQGTTYLVQPETYKEIQGLLAESKIAPAKLNGVDFKIVELLRKIDTVESWHELFSSEDGYAVICLMTFLEGYGVNEAYNVLRDSDYTLENIIINGPSFETEYSMLLQVIEEGEE